MIKGNIAGFSPFYGVQKLSGDKATDSFNFLTATYKALAGGLGGSISSAKDEGRSMEATFTTIGIGGEFGDLSFSVEQTQVEGAGYGETNYIPALVELDSARHMQLSYAIYPKVNISLFSHTMNAKEDSTLRSDITAFNALRANASFAAYTEALEQLTWTSSTSSGIAFSMKY